MKKRFFGLASQLGLVLCATMFAGTNCASAQNLPLKVTKKALVLDAQGKPTSEVQTELSQEQRNAKSTVFYSITYGPSVPGFDTTTLGALDFVDELNGYMDFPTLTVQKPTTWTTSGSQTSFSTPLLYPGGEGVGLGLPGVISTGVNGGDGFYPIVSQDPAIGRVFEIYHHWTPGYINCQSMTTGLPCPGFGTTASPKPKLLGKDELASGGAYNIQHQPRTVQRGNILYYPAFNVNGSSEAGIGCFDMLNLKNCNYLPIKINASYANGNMGGVVEVSSHPNWLFMTNGGFVYCYDLGVNGICAGYPKKVVPEAKSNGSTADIISAGDRVYVNHTESGIKGLACLDTVTGNACKGWETPKPVIDVFLHRRLTKTGDDDGVCQGYAQMAGCYDFNGNYIGNGPKFIRDRISVYFFADGMLVPGSKTKMLYGTAGNHAAICYDWATDAGCAGFKDGGVGAVDGYRRWLQVGQNGKPGLSSGTQDYGYTAIPGKGTCMVGLGHSGNLWSFDAATGNTPCTVSSQDIIQIQDPKPYCDGLDHGVLWNRAQLFNAPVGVNKVDFSVYDLAACPGASVAGCTVLATGSSSTLPAENLPATSPRTRTVWNIPFSKTISLYAVPSLKIVMNYDYGTNPLPTEAPKDFRVRALFAASPSDGSIGQVCVRVKPLKCPSPLVNNTAMITGKDANGGSVTNGTSSWILKTPMDDYVYSDAAPVVSEVLALGTSKYRQFETRYRQSDWSGDLREYGADLSQLSSDATTSAHPTDLNWAAALKLPADFTKRKVYTSYKSGVNTYEALAYTWSNLKDKLPAAAAMYGKGSHALSSTAGLEKSQTNEVEWVLGDRSNEVQGASPGVPGAGSGYLRPRMYSTTGGVANYPGTQLALGDMIHSGPTYVSFGGQGFSASQKGNNSFVFVQANDGMLHAFRDSDGEEVFAYIPQVLASQLPATSFVNWAHSYIMDGQQAIYRAADGVTLIGSTGSSAFASSIFGLDISPLGSGGVPKVKFDVTSPYLGRANGQLAVSMLKDGSVNSGVPLYLSSNSSSTPSSIAVALLGNGVGSTKGTAALVVINVSTGGLMIFDTGVAGGLGAPAAVQKEGKVYVYAGDSAGNLWRFELPSTWNENVVYTPSTSSYIQKIFLSNSAKPYQVISAAPAISYKQSTSPGESQKLWVVFGSGMPIDRETPSPIDDQPYYNTFINQIDSNKVKIQQATQSVRAIVDNFDGTQQNDSKLAVVTLSDDASGGRTFSPPVGSTKNGWLLDLNDNVKYSGERILQAPVIRSNGLVMFSSVVPRTGECDHLGMGLFVNGINLDGSSTQVFLVDKNKQGLFIDNASGALVSGSWASVNTATEKNGKPIPGTPEDPNKKLPLDSVLRQSWQRLY